MSELVNKALQVQSLEDNYAGCHLVELSVPAPKPNEICLRIEAATLGFPDLLMTKGAYQHKPDLPFVSGTEVAGEVIALGAEVEHFKLGDRVAAGKMGGGFAQFGCYDAASARHLPDNMTYASGAALVSAYLTAYVSLVRRGQLEAGEWVLVHGAAGGVGLAAIDLAKHLGARVIAASPSQEKLDQISALFDIDAVVNTKQGFREQVKEITQGKGADVIYDPVGGDVFDESTRCIAWGGRLLVVGFASGRIPQISVNMPLIKGYGVIGVRAGEYGRRHPEKGRENLNIIWDLAAKGLIKPHICAELPLPAWRQAFDMMSERAIVGRLIINPQLD